MDWERWRENSTDADHFLNGRTKENWFALALPLWGARHLCLSYWSALFHGASQCLCVLMVRCLTQPQLLFIPWLLATIAWPNNWEWPSRYCSGGAFMQGGQPAHVQHGQQLLPDELNWPLLIFAGSKINDFGSWFVLDFAQVCCKIFLLKKWLRCSVHLKLNKHDRETVWCTQASFSHEAKLKKNPKSA